MHTFREANRYVDFLAMKGYSATSFDWIVVEVVCPGLRLLLANDVRGSVLPRVV